MRASSRATGSASTAPAATSRTARAAASGGGAVSCTTNGAASPPRAVWTPGGSLRARDPAPARSEEHTSELQSRLHLVCRLLLEKKKRNDVNAFYCKCTLCC